MGSAFLLFAGCASTIKNPPVANHPVHPLYPPPTTITVGVETVFADGSKAVHMKRSDAISAAICKTVQGQDPKLKFVPVSEYDRKGLLACDVILRLACDAPKHESKPNKVVFTLLWPATVSIIATPIGLIGLSFPGLIEETAEFNWNLAVVDPAHQNASLDTVPAEAIKAQVSASGWGADEKELEESYRNADTRLIDQAGDFIARKDWAAVVKSVQAPQPEPKRPGDSSLATTVTGTGTFVLVIGIGAYEKLSPLTTPVADARAFADIMRTRYGCKVLLLENPKRADILDALSRVRSALTPDNRLIIYYAGHGLNDKEANEGYWLPADAAMDNKTNWIAHTAVTAELHAIPAKQILVISDSCYAGVMTRGLVFSDKPFSDKATNKKVRVALLSGGVEPVADTGGNTGHSVFAGALLNALEHSDGVISGNFLYGQVKNSVKLNSDQSPEFAPIFKAGHEEGDFFFTAPSVPTPAMP